jgi:CBS domain-containing protein
VAKTVMELLKAKNNEVSTIAPEASVYDAVATMADRQIGALVVIEGDKVIGIITERDYARKIILMNKLSKATPVREIMTDRVVYVRPEQPIEECMALMTERRIRHLPVINEDKLVGMISIGDLVKELISDKDFIIEQLTRYISGSGY